MPRLGVDAMEHILEHAGEVPRHAGDHRLRIAERNHAGGEMDAVLVDETLAIALEIALALEALVEIRRISGGALRHARILNLDPVAELNAGVLGGFKHAPGAADQKGGAKSVVYEARGGAEALFPPPLCKHDALGPPPQPRKNARQQSRHRVAS